MNEKPKKWKLILVGLMAGTLLGGTIAVTTPSVAAGPAKVWKQIKKKADKRYYTKKKANKKYAEKPTTIRGTYALSIQPPSTGTYGVTSISFGVTLPGSPVAHYIKGGDAVPPECAGGTAALPKASAGHLCVFEGYQIGANARGLTTVGYVGTNNANRTGAIVFGNSASTADVRMMGSWAVGTGGSADWRVAPKVGARPGE